MDSLGSSMTAVIRRSISWTNSMARWFHAPAVCIATGKKIWVFSSSPYLAVLLTAAMLAAAAGSVLYYYCSYYTAGYLGVDCSLNETVPPQVIGLRAPGPLCDVRGSTPCTAVSLFASGFSFTESFTCRVVSASNFRLLYFSSTLGRSSSGSFWRGWMRPKDQSIRFW